jgi:hypothetical protein
MQLTGDLSDFALTDILQILALSRKTGMVLLEGAGFTGKIIVESGRITEASMQPGESLADSLSLAGLLSPDAAREYVGGNQGDNRLEALLVGRGILTRNGLSTAVRRHTQRVIGKLVRLEKGRFSIALGEMMLPHSVDGLRLVDGLDVGEALLLAAHEQDESYKEREAQTSTADDDPGINLNGGRNTRPLVTVGREARVHHEMELSEGDGFGLDNHDRSTLLCSLLAEMKQHSFEAEVSLLIMRYASELATRGILFAIKDSYLCGLGQFGLSHGKDGKSPDEVVRELYLPLDAESVFARVARTGEPFVGGMPDSYWFSELLSRVGGFGHGLKLFVLPLICNEEPAFLLYGDNYPGQSELKGVRELVALASQASLVLERIALQRRVVQLESGS